MVSGWPDLSRESVYVSGYSLAALVYGYSVQVYIANFANKIKSTI